MSFIRDQIVAFGVGMGAMAVLGMIMLCALIVDQ